MLIKQVIKMDVKKQSKNSKKGKEKVALSLDPLNKTIFYEMNSNKIIDLHDYLLRKSNNKKQYGIVLESASSHHEQTLRLFFESKQQYDKNYKLIKQVWEYSQYDIIEQMLIKCNKKNYPLMKLNLCRRQSKISKATLDTQFEMNHFLTDHIDKEKQQNFVQQQCKKDRSFTSFDFYNDRIQRISMDELQNQFYSIEQSEITTHKKGVLDTFNQNIKKQGLFFNNPQEKNTVKNFKQTKNKTNLIGFLSKTNQQSHQISRRNKQYY